MQSGFPMFLVGNKDVPTSQQPGTSQFPDPMGQSAGLWTPMWHDEFDQGSLDTTKWQTKFPNWPRFTSQAPGGDHTNTGDASYYDVSKVAVSGSLCTLTSTLQTTVSGLAYTSGMLCSYLDAGGGFSFKYGYVEFKMRMQAMYHASWPSGWMHNNTFNVWPPEIDIMEAKDEARDQYLFNTYRADGTEDSTTVNIGTGVLDITTDTVYGLKWTSSGTTGYLNGVQRATSNLVLSDPMFLLMSNQAIAAHGPAWSSNQMYLDYVRVWQ